MNCEICVIFLFSVPSLQAMCRVAILESIDKKAVNKLPLPNALKQYLTYEANPDYVRKCEVSEDESDVGDVDESADDTNGDASGNGGGGDDDDANGDASCNGGGGGDDDDRDDDGEEDVDEVADCSGGNDGDTPVAAAADDNDGVEETTTNYGRLYKCIG
jgi:hypothetical protein